MSEYPKIHLSGDTLTISQGDAKVTLSVSDQGDVLSALNAHTHEEYTELADQIEDIDKALDVLLSLVEELSDKLPPAYGLAVNSHLYAARHAQEPENTVQALCNALEMYTREVADESLTRSA